MGNDDRQRMSAVMTPSTYTYGKYCFDVETFSKEDFSVAQFLEDCRLRNPMETIHQDLKDFQTTLENQLVAIINEDYAEFLQLSTKLKGVDEAVASVRSPLLGVLKRVDQVQQAMAALQSKIQKQAQMVTELNKAEGDLHLSIRISERLLRLEELLEVPSLDDDDHVVETTNSSTQDADELDFDNFDAIQQSEEAAASAEVCAKLERAAQNLIQLEREFFEGVEIPSVQREERRMNVIEETLLRRLETEFATEVFPDTFYNRDHTISAVSMSYLLRSYVLLQKSTIPEDMIARLLVQPFAEENLTRSKLDGRSRGSCEGLERIYESILEFVDKKFRAILQLPVCQGDPKSSIDVLGNAIWKPLQQIITSKLGIIFQAADPDRFHHNYVLTMRFLQSMEAFCPTEAAKKRFRSHESVVEFKEKWNMDVYFQLRYQQLSTALDEAFSKGKAAATESASKAGKLVFFSSVALWRTMQECLDDRLFLLPLLANFTKLCVQLLVHYIEIWQDPVTSAVEQILSGSKGNFVYVPSHFIANEDDVFGVANDYHVLYNKITSDLFTIMKPHVAPFVDDATEFVEALFQEPLESLRALEQKCWSAAVYLVAEECKKVLPALRTVKGQYQMTNKPPPTTPSSYIANIVRPVGDFLSKWGVDFDPTKKQHVLQLIFQDICDVYESLSSELLKSAMELEESLKSRKLQRNSSTKLTDSSDGNDQLSDTEKMRMQLLLDLDEMARLVTDYGFVLEQCEAFQQARTSLTLATTSAN